MSVSAYAPNIVTMIGLGVAIDYSLFSREPLSREIGRRPVPEALARTMSTTGRAMSLLRVTVAIGLLGMLALGLGNIGSLVAGGDHRGRAVRALRADLPARRPRILGPHVNACPASPLASSGWATAPGFWHRPGRASS